MTQNILTMRKRVRKEKMTKKKTKRNKTTEVLCKRIATRKLKEVTKGNPAKMLRTQILNSNFQYSWRKKLK